MSRQLRNLNRHLALNDAIYNLSPLIYWTEGFVGRMLGFVGRMLGFYLYKVRPLITSITFWNMGEIYFDQFLKIDRPTYNFSPKYFWEGELDGCCVTTDGSCLWRAIRSLITWLGLETQNYLCCSILVWAGAECAIYLEFAEYQQS